MALKDNGHLPFLMTEELFVIKKEFGNPLTSETSEVSPVVEKASNPQPEQTIKASDDLVFHGTGKNGLLVLLGTPLDAPSKELLTKMLQAVKFSLEDSLLIVLTENRTFSLTTAYQQSNIERVIYFGDAGQVNTVFSQEVSAYFPMLVDGKFVVTSDSLSAVGADVDKKKKLWEAMKKVFY